MENKFSNFEELISFIETEELTQVEALLQKHGFEFSEEQSEKELFRNFSSFKLGNSVKFEYNNLAYKVETKLSENFYEKLVDGVGRLSKSLEKNKVSEHPQLLNFDVEDAA